MTDPATFLLGENDDDSREYESENKMYSEVRQCVILKPTFEYCFFL